MNFLQGDFCTISQRPKDVLSFDSTVPLLEIYPTDTTEQTCKVYTQRCSLQHFYDSKKLEIN